MRTLAMRCSFLLTLVLPALRFGTPGVVSSGRWHQELRPFDVVPGASRFAWRASATRDWLNIDI
jgi:hypothetical protein